jgi:hypothetical protein
MRQYDAQLLCTFTKYQTYNDTIISLTEYYDIIERKIYVLQSGLNRDDVFLTFNAAKQSGQFHENTISVHRKKEYNVIYSINALNEIIKMENNGKVSNTYQINWERYRNSFITARDGAVKITPTRLLKIIQIS